MKNYELVYLISPNLSTEDSEKLLGKVISHIQTQPMKQQSSNSWVSLDFRTEPDKIAEIEKELKQEPQILRYMILIKEIPKKAASKPPRRPQKRSESAELSEKKVEEKKVELKEIEKKLEEILGE